MRKRRDLIAALEASRRTNEILLEIIKRQEKRLEDLLDRFMAQDFQAYKEGVAFSQILPQEPQEATLDEELAGEIVEDLKVFGSQTTSREE